MVERGKYKEMRNQYELEYEILRDENARDTRRRQEIAIKLVIKIGRPLGCAIMNWMLRVRTGSNDELLVTESMFWFENKTLLFS